MTGTNRTWAVSGALCAATAWLAVGCGSPHSVGALDAGTDAGSQADSGAPSDGGASLIGTWDVTITQTGSSTSQAVVVVGTDALNVNGNGFSFSVLRSSNELLFTDTSGSTINVTATQTESSFNGGIVPFNMGGSWSITGGSPADNCTAQIAGQQLTSSCGNASPYQDMTLTKTSSEASVYGDFGGTWAWTWNFQPGTTTCALEFKDSGITQICSSDGGSALNGATTFQFNGNTVSGTAPSGVEFSATRR